MKEFIRRLGKKVQELLDKIFGKEEPKQKYDAAMIEDDEELKVALENLKADFIDADWGQIACNIEAQLALEHPTWSKSELENFVNITYPFLPKRIPCRGIILSFAANQQSDYQAVDFSQHEERGIAHCIIGRTCGLEQWLDAEWTEEEIAQCKESGLLSVLIPDATLLYYEALGIWDFEEHE